MKRLCIIAMVVIAVGATTVPSCHRRAPATDAPHPRIVCVCPALTTMLFDMGLGDHVVGVTPQDILPPGVQLPVVGDVFAMNVEAVIATRPDVLVTNVNLEHFAAVRQLDPNIRIEHFRLETLDDVAGAMERLAAVAGKPQRGKDAADAFRTALERIRARVAERPRPRVLFLTDFQSLGTGGRGTFVDHMIRTAGGANAAEKYSGWTTLTAEGVIVAAPEVLICQVTSDAEARQARRFLESLKDLPAVRTGRIHVITDRRWTIPTAALADFTAELAEMIHPDLAHGEQGDP